MLTGPLTGPISFDSNGQRSSFQLKIIELAKQQFRISGTWDSDNPKTIYSTFTSEEREKEQYDLLKGKTFIVVSRWLKLDFFNETKFY